MKPRLIFCLIYLVLFVSGVSASEKGSMAVSPGFQGGVAVVGQNCPTFSWTAVEWATAYRVEIFMTVSAEVLSYDEMVAKAYSVLTKEIQGRALSWTPSTDERLSNGGVYVWYVQAVDAYGTAKWSEGRSFRVEVEDRLTRMVDKVTETLKENGVSKEVINDVLSDMVSAVKEQSVSAYSTQDTAKIQGNEVGSNTWYGENAGFSLTTGVHNSFFGYHAGYSNSTAHGNTIMGWNAGHNNIGSNNTFIGRGVGYTNTTGFYNVFIGRSAGEWNDTGSYNTFIGAEAGFNNTIAQANIFIGESAGWSNTIGNHNTFIGQGAGYANTEGSSNVFLGYRAGYNETGSNKLYIDNSETSSPLIYGEFNSNIVAINGKLGVGTKSPQANLEVETSGKNAMFLLDRTDGAKTGIASYQNQGIVGTATNHPLLFVVNYVWKLKLNSDNSLIMANGAKCTSGGVWQDASSREYKENIKSLSVEEAKDTLSALKPVRYVYKKDKGEEYLGFIAEDVPKLVASKDRKGMSPMDVVAVLTKVAQEQQENLKEQQKTISELQKRIVELEKKPRQNCNLGISDRFKKFSFWGRFK